MSYVVEHRWDVFLSYASVDNQTSVDSTGWVSAFAEALRQALDVVAGRREGISVFRDDALRQSKRVSETIDRAVQNSAVLLALVSRGFDESTHCRRELALFEHAAATGTGLVTPDGSQRIIPVRLAYVAGHAHATLAAVTGHNFVEAGEAFPIQPGTEQFTRLIHEVAVEIGRVLDELRVSTPSRRYQDPLRWLGVAERAQLTGILHMPVLGLFDEDQRSALLARAFASRAPSLYSHGRELRGSPDEWAPLLIDDIENYGAVDDVDAATVLLETLLVDAFVAQGTLEDCRRAVTKAWEEHLGRSREPASSSSSHEARARVIAGDEVTLTADDPIAELGAGWARAPGERPRRVRLARGHSQATGTDPSHLTRLVAFTHPHVLPIVDYLVSPGTVTAECRWRPGQVLRSIGHGLGLPDAVEYVGQIADALEVAHCHGLIHGQLDPRQVLIDLPRRYATITGLGYIAAPEGGRPQHAWRNASLVEEFVAPEARRGAAVPSSDQYSLGMLFYALLLGDLAISTSGSLRSLGAELAPPPVVPVIEEALADNPDDRYASAMELADALRSAVESGSKSSTRRASEHRYLLAMRQECTDALQGYVELRGSRSRQQDGTERRAITGAGLTRVQHPVLYSVREALSNRGPRTSEDVSGDLLAGGRILLLGEPGSGKTTTLLHAAQDAAREAQRYSHAPIPVVLPLNLYDGTVSIHEFAETHMAELGHDAGYLKRDGRLLYFCDGLNEAPARARDAFRSFAQSTRDFVVSCRIRDYEQELQDVVQVTTITILPLDVARVKQALERILGPPGVHLWEMLGGCPEMLQRLHKMQQQSESDRYWEATYVPGYTTPDEDIAWEQVYRDGALELCQNPFLLRVVAELFRATGSVPRNRAAIFEHSVKSLLQRELGRPAAPEAAARLSEDRITDALTDIAASIQDRHEGVGINPADAITKIIPRLGADLAPVALDLAEDASIITLHGGRFGFTHQLLQEYFAATVMQQAIERKDGPQRFFPREQWWRPQGWEETAVILAGMVSASDAGAYLSWFADAHPPLAIRCLEEARLGGWTVATLPEEIRSQLQARWLTWACDTELDSGARVAVLDALGRLGDPRPGVHSSATRSGTVPDVSWVSVPGLGIEVSRYPVTASQFACFVAAAGSTEGADTSAPAKGVELPTEPQTGVTWQAASDYCTWLGRALNAKIRLPAEQEWAVAASLGGHHDVDYPWGMEWKPTCGNVAEVGESSIGRPSPVGAFDDGKMPIADAFGNVWEWCLDGQGVADEDGPASKTLREARLVKGGSWRRGAKFARLGYRYWADAQSSADDVGFRVVRVDHPTSGGG